MEKEEILIGIWRYVRFVLLITLAVAIVTAASFLIWGPFTFRDYTRASSGSGSGP